MLRYIRDLLGRIHSTSTPRETPVGLDTTVVYLRVGVNALDRFRDLTASQNLTEDAPLDAAEHSLVDQTLSPPQFSPESRSEACVVATDAKFGRPSVRSESRQTRDNKSVRSLGLFSRSVADKLESLGLRTAGDLLACNPQDLAVREASLARRIRRAQRAIRFSRRFPEMTPPDALLLFAVHRRSRKAIASEPPALLRRDIQRLLISSRGQKRWGARPAPPIAQVKAWVNAAQRS
jgi:hypothetical protein